MEQRKTFADNMMEYFDDMFQLLISDELNNYYNDEVPTQTTLDEDRINETDKIFYIDNDPILGVRYNPKKSIHTLYVRPKRSDNKDSRGSKNFSARYALPTARSQQTEE